MSYHVNNRYCDTCIFTDCSIITPARLDELKRYWETEGVIQQCHDSTLLGGNLGCRGYLEAWKMGLIKNNPIDPAAKAIGLPDALISDKEQLTQILVRLGLIVYVSPSEDVDVYGRAVQDAELGADDGD